MPRVWVSIGSNIERERHIRAALDDLRETFGELDISPVYETEAVGFTGDAFFNLVAGFDTELAPQVLHRLLRKIESRHGRERSGGKFAARTLDLDLLLYGDARIDTPTLTVPHPRMEQRAFVLEPLCELAPDLVLPSGRRVDEALAELATGGVR